MEMRRRGVKQQQEKGMKMDDKHFLETFIVGGPFIQLGNSLLYFVLVQECSGKVNENYWH